VAESVDNVADFRSLIQVPEIKRVLQAIYVDDPENQLPIDGEIVLAELTIPQRLLLRGINSLDQLQKVSCFCSIKLETTNNNGGILVHLFKLFLELLKLEKARCIEIDIGGYGPVRLSNQLMSVQEICMKLKCPVKLTSSLDREFEIEGIDLTAPLSLSQNFDQLLIRDCSFPSTLESLRSAMEKTARDIQIINSVVEGLNYRISLSWEEISNILPQPTQKNRYRISNLKFEVGQSILLQGFHEVIDIIVTDSLLQDLRIVTIPFARHNTRNELVLDPPVVNGLHLPEEKGVGLVMYGKFPRIANVTKECHITFIVQTFKNFGFWDDASEEDLKIFDREYIGLYRAHDILHERPDLFFKVRGLRIESLASRCSEEIIDLSIKLPNLRILTVTGTQTQTISKSLAYWDLPVLTDLRLELHQSNNGISLKSISTQLPLLEFFEIVIRTLNFDFDTSENGEVVTFRKLQKLVLGGFGVNRSCLYSFPELSELIYGHPDPNVNLHNFYAPKLNHLDLMMNDPRYFYSHQLSVEVRDLPLLESIVLTKFNCIRISGCPGITVITMRKAESILEISSDEKMDNLVMLNLGGARILQNALDGLHYDKENVDIVDIPDDPDNADRIPRGPAVRFDSALRRML
jgi:hypothetical protein